MALTESIRIFVSICLFPVCFLQFVSQNQNPFQQQGGSIGGLNQGGISPQQGGNIDLLTGLQPGPPGGSSRALGNICRFDGRDLSLVDWSQCDRRADEGWWHLYPFGERFNDVDIGNRPWLDRQIDLDFFFPYYGFRFNYTFIFPEGFIAFSYPQYIQPPYTFPNPGWPYTPDASIIAAFMTDQTLMAVGSTRISHVWYRVVARPSSLIGRNQGSRYDERQSNANTGQIFGQAAIGQQSRYYQGQLLKSQPGRVEDPDFLDQLTRDIRNGIVGARGFTADYALIVTWERMGYGGAPKETQLNLYAQFKKWQNTYQMVIASDEIRSYTMFNYGNINWTSSTSSGALRGRGGKQSAIVGFNGGNGTGFVDLPYSAEGNSYKLVQFGSTQIAGRWVARVDEEILYGGCINTSVGFLKTHIQYATMLGGFALNVSGPCFREGDIIKLQLDELTVACEKIDMVIARCVIPVNSIFRVGMVQIKLSTDGGKNYPFWNKFFILQPGRARRQVGLVDDPLVLQNSWRVPTAENLTLQWAAQNISISQNAQVDITLWGYWEDVEGHNLIEIGSIAKSVPNRGAYSFNPRTLSKTDMLHDAWKKYYGGLVQVRVSETWMSDRGDGIYWSAPIPFGWYYRQIWEYEYGKNWALDICRKWYAYDGARMNFIMELEPKISCPCTLDQAEVDFGRFTALRDCNMVGDSECYYTKGAKHCVVSTQTVWTGSAQMCCYDRQGWLMFSDDFEYNDQYLRFYAAGFPFRAHPWGAFPYKRPPFVPTMSNFYNDLLPYEFCCRWAGNCEFFYWRRQSSGCQQYKHPALALAYGQTHFVTYDGLRYPFHGKGYYVLTMMKGPRHDLMVQARFEQPPRTLWNTQVPATVITGIAARDNNSAIIQVFSRKEFTRWRYRMDIYVDGVKVFFDTPFKKLQNFQGVSIRSPDRNMNHSELDVMFETGVGLKVSEARGTLNIQVALPPTYNETLNNPRRYDGRFNNDNDRFDNDNFQPQQFSAQEKCSGFTRTVGLLGTFNNDVSDELTTPDCNILSAGFNNKIVTTEGEMRMIYEQFGEKWRVDGVRHPVLFQTERKPLYDPIAFASKDYYPLMDIDQNTNRSFWESLVFTREEVRVLCQSVPACMYDYITTGRREIGMDTLSAEKKFEGYKERGEAKLISCGPLVKNRGVIKYPIGNNYLDGVTVTFTCKPEYFLHGDQQRTCANGTWSPGWWVWCRKRAEETALKWVTGLLTTFLIVGLIAFIFVWCYCMRVRGNKYNTRRRVYQPPTVAATVNSKNGDAYPAPPTLMEKINYNVPVMEHEPKVGLHVSHRYSETTA